MEFTRNKDIKEVTESQNGKLKLVSVRVLANRVPRLPVGSARMAIHDYLYVSVAVLYVSAYSSYGVRRRSSIRLTV